MLKNNIITKTIEFLQKKENEINYSYFIIDDEIYCIQEQKHELNYRIPQKTFYYDLSFLKPYDSNIELYDNYFPNRDYLGIKNHQLLKYNNSLCLFGKCKDLNFYNKEKYVIYDLENKKSLLLDDKCLLDNAPDGYLMIPNQNKIQIVNFDGFFHFAEFDNNGKLIYENSLIYNYIRNIKLISLYNLSNNIYGLCKIDEVYIIINFDKNGIILQSLPFENKTIIKSFQKYNNEFQFIDENGIIFYKNINLNRIIKHTNNLDFKIIKEPSFEFKFNYLNWIHNNLLKLELKNYKFLDETTKKYFIIKNNENDEMIEIKFTRIPILDDLYDKDEKWKRENLNVLSYKNRFDLDKKLSNNDLTIVSAFINLSKKEKREKSLEHYFKGSIKFLQQNVPMILFIDEEFIDHIKKYRENFMEYTKIIITNIEDIPYYYLLDKINNCNKKNQLLNNIKDTPLYSLTNNSKFKFVNKAIELNPFQTENFAWIDFAIGHNDKSINYIYECIHFNHESNKICLSFFNPHISCLNDIIEYYDKSLSICCAGYLKGNKKAWEILDKEHEKKYLELIEKGYILNEELILGDLIINKKELFNIFLSCHQSIFSNRYHLRETHFILNNFLDVYQEKELTEFAWEGLNEFILNKIITRCKINEDYLQIRNSLPYRNWRNYKIK